jgi:dUTP pyrophosphatase
MKARIYRICKDNPLPTQANIGDAGFDCYTSEDIIFDGGGQTKLVPLGIIAEAPPGYHFKLCVRSSFALKRGFTLANSVGIIDSKFSGSSDEIKAIITSPFRLVNALGESHSIYGEEFPLVIKKHERICQLILEKNNDIEWDEQEDRNFKGRSRGGFGSSG